MNTAESRSVNLTVLKTSTLIRRLLEHCPVTEIYEKAIRCYETLIEANEREDTAKEISALLNIPVVRVKEYAEAVINILLFNKENDPYLSFGLEKTAPFSEVTRRWKRLIVLYHPDRHPNRNIFEEKVKRINEIYAKLQKLQRQKVLAGRFNAASEMILPKQSPIIQAKYVKYIPSLIIALAVLVALFSMVLFVFALLSSDPSASPNDLEEKKITIIRINIARPIQDLR